MTSPPPPPFGQLLKRHRIAAGLTQEALAERAGLAARTISDLERGLRPFPYRYTVTKLARALQISESEATELHAAAQRTGTPRPYPAASGRAAQPTSATLTLVGRQREIAHLEHVLAGGGPPVLALVGEPGIGKTRLLREAATRAAVAGWGVIEGACQQHGLEEPFAALAASLARFLATQPVTRQRTLLQGCEWLVPLMPELATSGVVPMPQGTPTPERARWLMFAAVGRFLANSAGPAGTLLLLDDVQWASADALALLTVLLEMAPRVRSGSLSPIAALRLAQTVP